jgi:hypothetical protein
VIDLTEHEDRFWELAEPYLVQSAVNALEQRVENLDVVTTGCAMTRALGVGTSEAGVDVGAADQDPDDGGAVGDVAGPVSHHMEQRASHTAVVVGTERSGHKLGIPGEQAREHGNITGVDRLHGGDSAWIVSRNDHERLAG